MDTSDSKTELLLGEINGFSMKVKLPDMSAVEEVAKLTVLPVGHLVIVGYHEDLVWEEFFSAGSERGDLTSLGDRHMKDIVNTFLPGLNFEDAAWRYEVNSEKAASRPTVHTHIIVGHMNLYGPTGLIRRCIDSILRITSTTP